MIEIVAATGNRNKLAELRTVAEGFGVRILDPLEVRERHGLPAVPDVDETGTTFEANARLKAEAFRTWCGLPCLGDDSGLEVYALDLRPGIYSARYAGPGASDTDRMAKLVAELDAALERNPAARNLPYGGRGAQFRAVLVLSLPSGQELTSEGVLEGEILHRPRGSGGFGYDPIVLIHELDKTLAEVDFEVTCTRGFRARAMRSLLERLPASK